MATGIKPNDVFTSSPLDPLKVRSNRVVSPTLGGAGNTVQRPTDALDPFTKGVGKVKSTKTSTRLL